MSKEELIKYENMYSEAIGHALDTKRRYLTEALAQEGRDMLRSIGLDGWSEEARARAYERDVVPYWEKFCPPPKRMWFELYGSREHRMDPRFLPADLYFTGLLPYMNNGLQHHGLINKGCLDYLFSDVKQPETVILRIEGVYCDEKRNLIREEEAIGRCRERGGPLFLKRSIESKSGKGIFVFTPGACDAAGSSGETGTLTDEEIRGLFREAGPSFVVQEKIRQHPRIQKLNSSSVSTIRILSLLMEDGVYIQSAVLRISSPHMPYVTVRDGGFYVEIMEDGRLNPRAFDNRGGWTDHGRGLYDDGFVMPSMDRVYEEVRRIHPRIGHIKCVGWDFAVDDQGDPVLIEFNAFPGLGCSQTTCCRPIFGEQTDWILEDYFLRRTWEKNHRQDILIY